MRRLQAQYSTDGAGNLDNAEQRLVIGEDNGDVAQLHRFRTSLPAADNNANFHVTVQIIWNSGTQDYGYVDDVLVIGTHI